MNLHAIRWCSLALALVFAGLLGFSRAGETDEEKKKLEEIRRQLQELREKEKELRQQEKLLLEQERALLKAKLEKEREAARKEAERRQKEELEKKLKEEAERKKHAAKVEIRGKLIKGVQTVQETPNYQIQINELTWTLHFGTKRELKAEAEKLEGKSVIIKGTVANTRPKQPFGMQWSYPQPWPTPPNPSRSRGIRCRIPIRTRGGSRTTFLRNRR